MAAGTTWGKRMLGLRTHTDVRPDLGEIPATTPSPGYDEPQTLLALRTMKFRALSSLFRLDVARYESAIETLMVCCPGTSSCPVTNGSVCQAGKDALAWVHGALDADQLRAEHLRLFGGEDQAHQMPMVSPCAGTYMTEEYEGNPEDVVALYDALGFSPYVDNRVSPGHISNELEFMAYCLECDGEDAKAVANRFVRDHLFGWGLVFSAATYARSEHPVTRFAGMMLEHMLFCELEHARGRERIGTSRPEPTAS